MRNQLPPLAAAFLLFGLTASAQAIEGSSVAGPIGGTDMRSAQIPPPGLYGGAIGVYIHAHGFVDGGGNTVEALSALDITRKRVGPFLIYVPKVELFGGGIAFGGIVPFGMECGRLFMSTPKRCISGAGDPYLEAVWSRYFGTIRASKYPGALPITEGLTIELGFGTVVPAGKYNVVDATTQGLSIGNNVWDFAPLAAFTYMTKPIIAEGTEFSARVYWNNYLTNPDTHYHTGALLDVDFAITERIGRVQVGLAGFYTWQVSDDTINGVSIPPDGMRWRVLDLGGVLVYDMPELATSIKLKALSTVMTANTVKGSWGVSLGFIHKLW